MIHESSRPVTVTLRLYRAISRAFPYEFKNAYGSEMLQVTEEAIEPIWLRHGIPGLLRLLMDVAIRIPAEHLALLRHDLRFGLRMLAGSPGFTAVAFISLTLGICIATCADSEMNGMILRNLPAVSNPDELAGFQMPVSYPDYKRYRELHDLFLSTLAYMAPVPFAVIFDGRTERTWGHLVTPSYFATMGVRPLLGRDFDQQDGQPGQQASIMVSYRFLHGALGGDPSIIGRTLRLNGQPVTIVGVGPKDFLGASPALFTADIWMPLSAGEHIAPELSGNALERHDLKMFHVVGRLQPGVTTARAEAELDSVARQVAKSYGDAETGDQEPRVLLVEGGKLLPLRKQDMPLFTEFFMVLAGLVLLIACTNVANMMLARAADRRKEVAIRLALGASRLRILRQLLTESMMIAAAAGLLGFLLSVYLMHLLSRMRMPFPMPITYDLHVDWRALMFTSGVTLLTGPAFGLAPALQATRLSLTPALKEGAQIQLRRHRRLSLRNGLLVTQLAGSLMLLLILGLLALGIQGRMGIEQGFDARNLYLASIDPVRDGYSREQAEDFLHKLLERVQRLPSITAASLTESLPAMFSGDPGVTFSTTSGAGGKAKEVLWAAKYVVGKDYFLTAGIPILSGRAFRKDDETDDAQAVIVSRELVRRVWKGQDPLGRRIEVGNDDISPGQGAMPGSFDFRATSLDKKRQVFEVVGVAGDVSNELVVQKPRPAIYFPLRPAEYAQPSLVGVTLMVRAAPGLDTQEIMRHEIATMDPNITPFNARSMTQQIDEFMVPLQTASWTYGCIGIFGLVLAAVGLAGVTAYSVLQRTHEIGVRLALGAKYRDVLALVMKESVALVALGTVIGMTGAWAGMRLMSGLFSSVASTSASNPVLVVGTPLLLAGLALTSCYLPARRSMRIDPAAALRQE